MTTKTKIAHLLTIAYMLVWIGLTVWVSVLETAMLGCFMFFVLYPLGTALLCGLVGFLGLLYGGVFTMINSVFGDKAEEEA